MTSELDLDQATREAAAAEAVPYDALPVHAASGSRHAWTQFADGDLLGSLNRLSPSRVRDALESVVTGQVVPLDLRVGEISPPLFDRPAMKHVVMQSDRNFFEDKVDDFYLQSTTQWDGFGHVRFNQHGFWQGRTAEPRPGDALGVDAWARKGIVGRGVLLDVDAYLAGVGRPIVQGLPTPIAASDLAATADWSGVEVHPGDVLCVRSGWLAWYRGLDAAERRSVSASLVAPGLAGAEEIGALLWDWRVAAVAVDNPAVEPTPGDAALHKHLIPMLGFAVGELFDFDALAALAARDGRYDFLFTSAPLQVPGSLGSPANAMAVR